MEGPVLIQWVEIEKQFMTDEKPPVGKSSKHLPELLNVRSVKFEAFLHKETPFAVHEETIDPDYDVAEQLADLTYYLSDVLNARFSELLEKEED